MTGSKMVQIIPAGARQVAPGVFQAARHRSHGGGGHHPKHRAHHRGGFRQTSMFGGSAAKALMLLSQVTGRLPQGMSPGIFLFQWGASKHNLGVQNIGKFLWLQSLAATNPAMLQFLGMGGGDPMMSMLGLGGGFFGGGGPGPGVRGISTPSFTAPSASQVNATADEISAANNMLASLGGI